MGSNTQIIFNAVNESNTAHVKMSRYSDANNFW